MDPGVFVLSAAAITGLAGFTGWIVKDYIKNLKDQVREANKRTETVNAQVREGTKAINDLSSLVRDYIAKIDGR